MNRSLPLRRPRLAIFALAAFAFAALTLWRVQALYADRAQALATSQGVVAAAAVYVSNYIARTVDAADLLADDAAEFIEEQGGLAATTPAALEQRLRAAVDKTSIVDNIVVVDATGRAIASSTGAAGRSRRFNDREWFRAHVAGADSYLGPAVRSRVMQQVVYTYSLAIRGPDGALQGVVSVGVAPTQPPPLAERKPGEPFAQLWTTDRRLIVASHMDFDAQGNPLPQRAPFNAPPAGAVGFLTTGPERAVAFAAPSGQPLLATVALARDEILAPWRRSVLESFILLAVSGLVMGVLAAIASRFADQDYRARLELEETARALTSALGEKELLLKEIHHRVKNNLQITSNLIRLQSRQFKDPEVLDAFQQTQQRLRSISLVHDVLYHENTSAVVDLLVYLTELTREIATANGAEARGVAVTIESDPVVVSPSQVTPLGLCLGEVLTNAFKHAFPEGSPSGLIAVTGRASGEEIEVTVRDNGRGFDPEQTRKGSLGLMLITVLTQQLRGRFSFSNEGGTVFRLSFPKA